MDFLEKLNYLMNKNGLNKSTLSKACDIPYTTIDGWYKKGYEGLKLTTLRKLSKYFGTSLDYWVSDVDSLDKDVAICIGDKIRARREELGLTLEEVGDYIGVNKATVQRYESGNMDIKRHVAIRLAEILHVTPSYIMGWDELPPSDTDASYIQPEYTDMAKLLQEKGITQDDFLKILRIYDAFNEDSGVN